MTARRSLPALGLLRVLTLFSCCALLALAAVVRADDEPKKYLLRYKAQQDQVLRWQVEQKIKIRATVNGSTQNSETKSDSVKAWKITDVAADGQFTLINAVEKMEMRVKTSGRAESVYDSETDKEPPPGFGDVAKTVGVPLSKIVLDTQGNIVKRELLTTQPIDTSGQLTVPFPKERIAVGGEWSFPHTISVRKKDKTLKQIKAVQRFTLKDVTGHVAVITMETAILTPVNDPQIEAQLVQRETEGTSWFDMEAGRIIQQELKTDKHVVGHIGENSSMQYEMSFTETLIKDDAVAKKQPAPKVK